MAYLRHLYLAREAAVVVLATVHNLHFFLSLMRRLRWAIITGRFSETLQNLRGEPGSGAG
jgi:queuine tRNA-ribosyltransferase